MPSIVFLPSSAVYLLQSVFPSCLLAQLPQTERDLPRMEKVESLFNSVTGRERVGFIDLNDTNLYIAAAAIAFNPIYWNIMAQTEYHQHLLTKVFRSPYYGCYFLAVTIFSLGIARDYLFNSALDSQPVYPALHQPLLGYLCFGIGQVFVLSSMWALGVTGTYLGDYFGILMESKVEGFPFSVVSSPMYFGSTLCFLGTALHKGRGAGIVLTLFVWVMYQIALRFEE
jgi:phosphatidylethanolamine/phosphatidyl-N-methylethanolamine N-methyltransferase